MARGKDKTILENIVKKYNLEKVNTIILDDFFFEKGTIPDIIKIESHASKIWRR